MSERQREKDGGGEREKGGMQGVREKNTLAADSLATIHVR